MRDIDKIDMQIELQTAYSRIAELEGIVKKQAETIRQLTERVEEFERRLKRDSKTSHIPSGADPFRKPKSSRESGKNPSGGQRGHKGTTLNMTTTPDKTETIKVKECEKCQADLSKTSSRKTRRAQVFDIPEPKILVTEYQTEEKVCICGHVTSSQFPNGVYGGAQYGARIRTIAGYLHVQQLIPEDRVAQTMQDLFGLKICAASIGNYVVNLAKDLAQQNEKNREIIENTRVKNSDETSMRIAGRTNWLQTQGTATHTYYKTTQKRGDIIRAINGIVVCDHFKSYKTLTGVKLAFCNAHHLRELEAVKTYDKESWAGSMKRLLQFACHTAKQPYVDKYIDKISKKFDELIDQGLAYHKTKPPLISKTGKKQHKSYNLLIRLRDNKESVLRFLYDKDVPFTNNLAERDLRMMKVKQKISGGFRSMLGAENFCCIRGVISTLQKQGESVLNFISSQYPSGLQIT